MKSKSICAGIAAALMLAVVGVGTPADAAPVWADPGEATIHPGVMTFTAGGQCTANFVFTDASDNVYIGQAAHCSATGAATDTNGCNSQLLPPDTEVEVTGASRPGTIVYNSWSTMQAVGEQDADACNYNDFALIELDQADRGKVNPSIPAFGGPVGIASPTVAGDVVHGYGNSSGRLGISELSSKTGISLGTIPSGWSHPVYTVTPGIPGDSGSAYLDAAGNALGVLSTLALTPAPLANNLTDIGLAVEYMEAHTELDVELVPGTEPFNSNGLVNGLLGGSLLGL